MDRDPLNEEYQPLILVLDDEHVMREGCARICQSLGCEALSAEGGKEGLRVLQEKPIDVMLLDLMMPGISGMEVLEHVREHHPELIVIVITGYATVELAVEAMKKGAYDFISKPFSPDQLRLVVNRALERRRLHREMALLRQERARSLRDVAEEQSRLRTIIHSMADGVMVTDLEAVVVLHNPPAQRLLDCEEGTLIHRPMEEIAPPEVAQMVRRLLEEPPGTARSMELAIKGVGEIRVHGSLVYLSEDEVMGTVTVLQDISPLKELDRMKSDFVAMVSHELRSPLSAIQQQLSVISGGMVGAVTEKQGSLLDRAQKRVQGLLDLIGDLLNLSRIEAGVIVERREPIQLEPLVERVVDYHKEQAQQKGLSLVDGPFPPQPAVVGDVGALEEVITNLLSNAIAYTDPGGEIRVACGKRGSYVCVEVMDTGIGIPKEVIAKIFDRFYRVKDERTRQVVGTGLGLPIVKGIVEAHLGAVEVESEVGKGSTFRVLLPTAHITKEGTV
jgi:PAS domain S-box-containing protein